MENKSLMGPVSAAVSETAWLKFYSTPVIRLGPGINNTCSDYYIMSLVSAGTLGLVGSCVFNEDMFNN